MKNKKRNKFMWLAVTLCLALLATTLPAFADALADPEPVEEVLTEDDGQELAEANASKSSKKKKKKSSSKKKKKKSSKTNTEATAAPVAEESGEDTQDEQTPEAAETPEESSPAPETQDPSTPEQTPEEEAPRQEDEAPQEGSGEGEPENGEAAAEPEADEAATEPEADEAATEEEPEAGKEPLAKANNTYSDDTFEYEMKGDQLVVTAWIGKTDVALPATLKVDGKDVAVYSIDPKAFETDKLEGVTVTVPDRLGYDVTKVIFGEKTPKAVTLQVEKETELKSATQIAYTEEVGGEKKEVTRTIPEFTDILVKKDGKLTVSADVTLAEKHALTIEEGGTLINNAQIDGTKGTMTNKGSFISCNPVSKVLGEVTGTAAKKGHTDADADGLCEICGKDATHSVLTGIAFIQPLEKTYDGNAKVPAALADISNLTVEGLQDGDEAASVLTLVSAKFSDANASEDNEKDVLVTVALKSGYEDKYTLDNSYAQADGSFVATVKGTIRPILLPVKMKGSSAITKEYDGTVDVPMSKSDFTVDTSKVLKADKKKVKGIKSVTGHFEDKAVGDNKPIVDVVIKMKGGKGGNYRPDTSAITGLTGSITKKTITLKINGDVPQFSKEYDGTTDAEGLTTENFTFSGMAEGDSLSLEISGAAYNSPNVSEASSITYQATLSGDDVDNYVLTDARPSVPASITPRSLRLTYNQSGVPSKTYDGTATIDMDPSAFSVDTSAMLPQDSSAVSIKSVKAVFVNNKGKEDKTVGEGKTVKFTAQLNLSGSATGNYVATSDPITGGSIKPCPVTVNYKGDAPTKTYNGTNVATLPGKFYIEGNVKGDKLSIRVSATYDDGKNVGTDKNVTANIELTGDDRGNYELQTKTLTVKGGSITQRPLTFGGYTGKALERPYDKTRNVYRLEDGNKVTPKGSEFSIKGKVSGDELKLSKISVAFDSAAVGVRKVNVSFELGGADAGNYTLPNQSVPGKITPKTLTITPGANAADSTELVSQTKVYGEKDPEYYRGRVSGLLGAITADDGTVKEPADQLSGRLGRATGENVGSYRITKGTLKNDNYNIVVENKNPFKITPKTLEDNTLITITPISNQSYTGKAVQPNPEIKYRSPKLGTVTLKKGRDYTLTYSNNIKQGVAKVRITGKGNYTGTREAEFRIVQTSGGGGGGGNSGSGGGSSGGGSNYSYNMNGGSSGSGSGYDDDDEGEDVTEDDEIDDGFDDDEGGDVPDDESEENGVPEDFEPEPGHLYLNNGDDCGTILFDEMGEPRLFTTGIEQILPEDEEEEEEEGDVPVDEPLFSEDEEEPAYRLTIMPEPMIDPGTGEIVTLEDGRERFEDLHLRLPAELVAHMIDEGFVELVYELDRAQLALSLYDLNGEINMDAEDRETYGIDDFEGVDTVDMAGESPIEADVNVVPGLNGENVAEPEAEAEPEILTNPTLDDLILNDLPEIETDLQPAAIRVDLYDIQMKQTGEEDLDERETKALEGYLPASPFYRVFVKAESAVGTRTLTNVAALDEAEARAELIPALPFLTSASLRIQPLDGESFTEGETDVMEIFVPAEPDDAYPLDEEALDAAGSIADTLQMALFMNNEGLYDDEEADDGEDYEDEDYEDDGDGFEELDDEDEDFDDEDFDDEDFDDEEEEDYDEEDYEDFDPVVDVSETLDSLNLNKLVTLAQVMGTPLPEGVNLYEPEVEPAELIEVDYVTRAVMVPSADGLYAICRPEPEEEEAPQEAPITEPEEESDEIETDGGFIEEGDVPEDDEDVTVISE